MREPLPVLIYSVLVGLNAVVARAFASTFGVGATSGFDYSLRLLGVPLVLHGGSGTPDGDLARAIGYAAALEKLREAYRPEAAQARELSRYPSRIPLVRLKVNMRAALRRLPPPVVDTLRTIKGRLTR